MTDVAQTVSNSIKPLPMDVMISGPLNAMIQAQVQSAYAYIDFVKNVGMTDGHVNNVSFATKEAVLDDNGNVVNEVSRQVDVPLLAIVNHPVVTVDRGTIDFEMTVSATESVSTTNEASGGFEGKVGWGPFSVKFHGQASHKSTQTRATDTRARYAFHVEVSRKEAPEGMQRVLDHLLNSVTARNVSSGTKPVTPNTPGFTDN